jgi:hypothetical protein
MIAGPVTRDEAVLLVSIGPHLEPVRRSLAPFWREAANPSTSPTPSEAP